jgi:hypothetical protein
VQASYDDYGTEGTGFDRLAEAHIVGDQQVHARHGERADDRVELVVLDRSAGAERGLEHAGVGGVDGAQRTALRKAARRSGSSRPFRCGVE